MPKIKKVFIFALGSCLLLASCATGQKPVISPAASHDNLTGRIHQSLQAGEPLVEIKQVDLILPPDIQAGQLRKYFKLGTIYFGLVLQNSMNVPLELPPDYIPTFTGILVSTQGEPWRKYWTIKDEEMTAKNNPYYLWTDGSKMFLSVVDQTGAGSGEGIMKLEGLSAEGQWELAGCYYFGANYSSSDEDGDYLAYSKQVDQQQKQSDLLCKNVAIELLKN